MPQKLRIFISSPGDVDSPREVAAQTIERLAQHYARFFAIEPYLWQNEPLDASRHFQDDIEPPSRFDIVVLILHARLGTPLPEKTAVREYRGIDGRAPVTGTEWEYEDALRAARQGGIPDLLVYRSEETAKVDTWDPVLRTAQLEQLAALDRFWERHFVDRGTFLGAYTRFKDLTTLAARLEAHLTELIERRIRERSERAVAPVWKEAPFRGLESYDFEHAAIFYGQDDAVSRAMLQLMANAAAGSPFLLVSGASGSGKSSLVKAGVLPKLSVPRRVSGLAFLRRLVLRPADAAKGEDIFKTLARKLCAPGAPNEGLPELLAPGQTVDQLASHLRGGGAAFSFGAALARVGAGARGMLEFEKARLVLVIDQLEELFTGEQIAPAERRAFARLLDELVRSELVWVIATIRNDFWHMADDTPELVRLAEGGGKLELLPTSPAQVGQIIRGPAEAAGVAYQLAEDANPEADRRAGISLDEMIAEAVARQAGALPLLSYLLDQLYRRDVLEGEGRTLTFATYDALGRLEGAIATRADEVLAARPAAERAALDPVLFSLVQLGVGEAGAEVSVARRAARSTFLPGSPEEGLVEAFLAPDARLLVQDADASGRAMLRVAHEALLTRWEVARRFVQTSGDLLRIRRRVEERLASAWETSGRASVGEAAPAAGPLTRLWRRLTSPLARQPGLLVDFDLADAQRLLRQRKGRLDAELESYIERSVLDDARIRGRAVRLAVAVAVVMSVLAVMSGALGLAAIARARDTLLAQSRFLAASAEDRLRDGDINVALSTVLQGLPGPGNARPVSAEAVAVLRNVVASDPQVGVLIGHTAALRSAAFSPDGRSIVTASRDGTARVWDAASGVGTLTLAGPGRAPLASAQFSRNGAEIVTAGDDGVARVWNAKSGALVAQLAPGLAPGAHAPGLGWAAFSPTDPNCLVAAAADGTASIWNVNAQRAMVLPARSTKPLSMASFSGDGLKVVTASGDGNAYVWDAGGGFLAGLQGAGGAMFSAVFSPRDPGVVLTASADHASRLWSLADPSHPTATLAAGDVDANLAGATESASFSADGSRILTVGDDWSVRVWDVATRSPIARLRGHVDGVEAAGFSPSGALIVSASADRTARLWEAPAGRQTAVVTDFGGAHVRSIAFARDGRLVTASSDGVARVRSTPGGPAVVFDPHASDPRANGWMNWAEFSPDGARLATASDDGLTRVWSAKSPAAAPLLTLPRGPAADIAESADFSPNGTLVVTASRDGAARIWRLADGEGGRPTPLFGHAGALSHAAFSPDGALIATAGLDGTVRLWSARGANAGSQLRLLKGHTDKVLYVAFSPRADRLVSAAADRTVRVWDVASGRQVLLLAGHLAQVEQAAFSPDGAQIASVSDDRTLRLWDARTGAPLAILRGHTLGVSALAFAPDGAQVATGSDDGSMRLWDVGPQALGQAGLLDLGPEASDSALAWARAAQFESLSGDATRQLGLTGAPARRAWNAVDPCDILAADPFDKQRRSQGRTPAQLRNAADAVAVCPTGVGGRIAYQRGRLLEAGSDRKGASQAYALAAASGYAMGNEALGRLLLTPDAGMFSPSRGLGLLQAAWKAGAPHAGADLAAVYGAGLRGPDGRVAVAADPAAASAWADRAASAGAPEALAMIAAERERQAVAATLSAGGQAGFAQALCYYALAAIRAQGEDWPDDLWRDWRYRRASLARLLAAQGALAAAAGAYRSAEAGGRCPS